MKKQVNLLSIVFVLIALIAGCAKDVTPKGDLTMDTQNALYASKGTEHKVQFRGLFRSDYKDINDVQSRTVQFEIQRITPFLFGPMTYRSVGGVQKGEIIKPLIDQAFTENGRIVIPYNYEGVWLVQRGEDSRIELPLPLSLTDLQNSNWQSCTDNYDEDHRTWSFLWYFWDPARPGCKNSLNQEYQNIVVEIGEETIQTNLTFPEYERMIHLVDGVPTMAMTFAFGYVEDVATPNPFKDYDYGMREFQRFHRSARTQLLQLGFQESPIYQRDITYGSTVIGALFSGTKNGIATKISILAAAGVDQMDIFANSYAKKHEGFFSWFGHSRVGAGFDADNLRNKLIFSPEKYKISTDYQLIYWAGCNSYSYYTLPFFEMKAAKNPQIDSAGTKNLDIISNTLPSLFAFNAANANIMFQALINWNNPTSYQSLVNEIETYAANSNFDVMVNVLGDEDNKTAP